LCCSTHVFQPFPCSSCCRCCGIPPVCICVWCVAVELFLVCTGVIVVVVCLVRRHQCFYHSTPYLRSVLPSGGSWMTAPTKGDCQRVLCTDTIQRSVCAVKRFCVAVHLLHSSWCADVWSMFQDRCLESGVQYTGSLGDV
jgi:hypothetical protein